MSLQDAVDLISQRRLDVLQNPSFLRQLRAYAQSLDTNSATVKNSVVPSDCKLVRPCRSRSSCLTDVQSNLSGTNGRRTTVRNQWSTQSGTGGLVRRSSEP